MELEQLRIFCTVAACRSFTRAAGQLFVSHSTTSVILADCTNFFAKFLRLSEKPS